jgi:hypothetical protein
MSYLAGMHKLQKFRNHLKILDDRSSIPRAHTNVRSHGDLAYGVCAPLLFGFDLRF